MLGETRGLTIAVGQGASARLSARPGRNVKTAAFGRRSLGSGEARDGTLGLANGDLFRAVLAFSPGQIVVNEPWRGRPRIFVSHGTNDNVLPIDRTSHRIVPALRERGYDVTFREFEGRHEAPLAIVRESFSWAARQNAGPPP